MQICCLSATCFGFVSRFYNRYICKLGLFCHLDKKMYIESQPASVHLRRDVIPVESPIPQVCRPPAILNHSSSLSLRGMEKTAPSFQEFVLKSSPVGQNKALPSAPQVEALPSPSISIRRPSSTYSQRYSQWAPTPESWTQRADSGTFLQPSICSISTSELVIDERQARQNESPLLQLRAYQPLLTSPSPSPSGSIIETPGTELSATSFEELFQDRHPSALLPPIDPLMTSRHYAKTLSPDKEGTTAAVGDYSSEQLWALEVERLHRNELHKSRSLDNFGLAMQSAPSPSIILSSRKWVEDKNEDSFRRSVLQPSPWAQPSIVKFKLRDSKVSDKVFGMDPIVRAAAPPLPAQQARQYLPNTDINTVERSPFEEQEDEDRGRRRYSSKTDPRPSVSEIDNVLSSKDEIDNAAVMSQADILAREYQNLLPSQISPSYQKRQRDSMDGRDVKLAPRPLFFNPRQVSKQRAEQYNRDRMASAAARYNQRRPATSASNRSNHNRRRNDSPSTAFPLKLSLTPDSTLR